MPSVCCRADELDDDNNCEHDGAFDYDNDNSRDNCNDNGNGNCNGNGNNIGDFSEHYNCDKRYYDEHDNDSVFQDLDEEDGKRVDIHHATTFLTPAIGDDDLIDHVMNEDTTSTTHNSIGLTPHSIVDVPNNNGDGSIAANISVAASILIADNISIAVNKSVAVNVPFADNVLIAATVRMKNRCPSSTSATSAISSSSVLLEDNIRIEDN